MSSHTLRLVVSAVALSLLASCGDERNSLSDNIPPAPITNLVVGRPMGNTLTVAWTAPGDDSTSGQSTYYDVRFSKNQITDQTWGAATRYSDAAPPFRAGSFQGCQVFGLEASTEYYFAVKSADEAGNWSLISNVVSAVTTDYSDSIPPSSITDLTVDSTSPFSVSLSWTAPGDDGTTGDAASYDARFSLLPILTDNDWSFSARLSGEPAPVAAGLHQSMTVTGLVPSRELYFAIRAGDEITNWSELSTPVMARTRAAEDIPPATITDLTIGIVTLTSVEITWTAPGDDSMSGTASQYDVRRNWYPFTDETWDQCPTVANEPGPAAPGTLQSMTLTGLGPYETHHIAIRTADEIPNWSKMSNMVTVITAGNTGLVDTVAPARVGDLTVIASSSTALTLRWRSVGDDNYYGNALQNDMRYSTDSITNESWETATIVDYVYPPRSSGTIMTMDVKFLSPATTYFFAIKVGDEFANWSTLSNIARGTTRP